MDNENPVKLRKEARLLNQTATTLRRLFMKEHKDDARIAEANQCENEARELIKRASELERL